MKSLNKQNLMERVAGLNKLEYSVENSPLDMLERQFVISYRLSFLYRHISNQMEQEGSIENSSDYKSLSKYSMDVAMRGFIGWCNELNERIDVIDEGSDLENSARRKLETHMKIVKNGGDCAGFKRVKKAYNDALEALNG